MVMTSVPIKKLHLTKNRKFIFLGRCFWDTGTSVPFKKLTKKNWEKFPIQKYWHCDTIILCPVSHWKGQVSRLKIIEKNIFGTLGPVSHSKN